MGNSTITYPRFLIRTSQACAVVLIVEFMLMMAVLTVAAAASSRPLARFALPLACAMMSAGFSRKTLLELQRLERSRSEPDELMLSLFDVSLGVSTLGLLAVIAATLP